ncbi:hypothetical protein KOW79_018224 [Hemibagrus wyckioides]|uniref:Uncharacterized protein n=1 Tax=Hemibagrus wyckioides TaxID=337641 RepID=A0A9D3SGV1_9TELE|nr:hypothetical protein KOW79_018224 [Hemibagrus wyckioides]
MEEKRYTEDFGDSLTDELTSSEESFAQQHQEKRKCDEYKKMAMLQNNSNKQQNVTQIEIKEKNQRREKEQKRQEIMERKHQKASREGLRESYNKYRVASLEDMEKKKYIEDFEDSLTDEDLEWELTSSEESFAQQHQERSKREYRTEIKEGLRKEKILQVKPRNSELAAEKEMADVKKMAMLENNSNKQRNVTRIEIKEKNRRTEESLQDIKEHKEPKQVLETDEGQLVIHKMQKPGQKLVEKSREIMPEVGITKETERHISEVREKAKAETEILTEKRTEIKTEQEKRQWKLLQEPLSTMEKEKNAKKQKCKWIEVQSGKETQVMEEGDMALLEKMERAAESDRQDMDCQLMKERQIEGELQMNKTEIEREEQQVVVTEEEDDEFWDTAALPKSQKVSPKNEERSERDVELQSSQLIKVKTCESQDMERQLLEKERQVSKESHFHQTEIGKEKQELVLMEVEDEDFWDTAELPKSEKASPQNEERSERGVELQSNLDKKVQRKEEVVLETEKQRREEQIKERQERPLTIQDMQDARQKHAEMEKKCKKELTEKMLFQTESPALQKNVIWGRRSGNSHSIPVNTEHHQESSEQGKEHQKHVGRNRHLNTMKEGIKSVLQELDCPKVMDGLQLKGTEEVINKQLIKVNTFERLDVERQLLEKERQVTKESKFHQTEIGKEKQELVLMEVEDEDFWDTAELPKSEKASPQNEERSERGVELQSNLDKKVQRKEEVVLETEKQRREEQIKERQERPLTIQDMQDARQKHAEMEKKCKKELTEKMLFQTESPALQKNVIWGRRSGNSHSIPVNTEHHQESSEQGKEHQKHVGRNRHLNTMKEGIKSVLQELDCPKVMDGLQLKGTEEVINKQLIKVNTFERLDVERQLLEKERQVTKESKFHQTEIGKEKQELVLMEVEDEDFWDTAELPKSEKASPQNEERSERGVELKHAEMEKKCKKELTEKMLFQTESPALQKNVIWGRRSGNSPLIPVNTEHHQESSEQGKEHQKHVGRNRHLDTMKEGIKSVLQELDCPKVMDGLQLKGTEEVINKQLIKVNTFERLDVERQLLEKERQVTKDSKFHQTEKGKEKQELVLMEVEDEDFWDTAELPKSEKASPQNGRRSERGVELKHAEMERNCKKELTEKMLFQTESPALQKNVIWGRRSGNSPLIPVNTEHHQESSEQGKEHQKHVGRNRHLDTMKEGIKSVLQDTRQKNSEMQNKQELWQKLFSQSVSTSL